MIVLPLVCSPVECGPRLLYEEHWASASAKNRGPSQFSVLKKVWLQILSALVVGKKQDLTPPLCVLKKVWPQILSALVDGKKQDLTPPFVVTPPFVGDPDMATWAALTSRWKNLGQVLSGLE